jgi:nucleotide-binding universal stress UspA family protein
MYERILVPLKSDPGDDVLVEHAASLAALTGGVVILAHVVHSHSREEAAFLEGEAREELNRLGEELSTKGVRTEILVAHGEPGEGILGAIKQIDADLVVMATHGHGNVRHLLVGSVTEEIIRNSDAPVLLIRP